MRDTDLPIRASVLRGLPELIDDLGGSGEEFLARYGIDQGRVARNDAYVSLRTTEQLLEDAAREFRAPNFGLRMASQQDLHMLGPLAIAMENARTIGESLECANRFMVVLSPALSLAVLPDPLEQPAVLAVRHASTTGTASPQAIDYGLGINHRILTLLNGGIPYGLRSVQLPHPRLAPAVVYRDYFGADVEFDCPQAALRVPRQLVDVEISGGNDLLRDIAMDFLEAHFSRRDVPVADLVYLILQGQLGPHRPDLAKVARLLNLHPRSLQRLLAGEGLGFKDLVDRARREQTLNLITTTGLSFSQIAVQVGLREQSSLTRAVRRWFGASPSELRGSAGATGSAPQPPA
ncbi:MAG: AraC family transcriptional regulator [Sporichthyaceae bacterium]